MFVKLLQAKQEILIHKLLREKDMVLNKKNNQKDMQLEIIKRYYTYIFTNPEIGLSKKFKKNVLDSFQFTDCLYLFAIDKIHLVKEWNKNFWSLYTEIEKVLKIIPCHVLFLIYPQP